MSPRADDRDRDDAVRSKHAPHADFVNGRFVGGREQVVDGLVARDEDRADVLDRCSVPQQLLRRFPRTGTRRLRAGPVDAGDVALDHERVGRGGNHAPHATAAGARAASGVSLPFGVARGPLYEAPKLPTLVALLCGSQSPDATPSPLGPKI